MRSEIQDQGTHTITLQHVAEYQDNLLEQERAPATVEKYVRDLYRFRHFLGEAPLTKAAVIAWKNELAKTYAISSVNSMLAAVNSFLVFRGSCALTVKPLKMQKALFLDVEKELTREEYVRLVHAAYRSGNVRLALVMQTICATGIRVSELQYITGETVQAGRAVIANKGKCRIVFLPGELCRVLRSYLNLENRTTGAVFITPSGKPMDRSNIWREMRKLCQPAGVPPEKVFPHNLRKLFARTYYERQKDLSRLADILGHTNINTTRIYTAESGLVHAQQIENLALVIT